MIKPTSAAVLGALIASVALALAPLSAQAATANHGPLNPCRTFTPASADRLFGISRHIVLHEKVTRTNRPFVIRTCTVRNRKLKLTVQTQFHPGSAGNSRCYRRPALGPKGEVCLSRVRSLPFTFSVFHRNGVYFSAGINEELPHQGAAIYRFALAQYAKLAG